MSLMDVRSCGGRQIRIDGRIDGAHWSALRCLQLQQFVLYSKLLGFDLYDVSNTHPQRLRMYLVHRRRLIPQCLALLRCQKLILTRIY